MIVTISPSEAQFEDTLNTLKYANRAKNIRTKAVENKALVQLHIAEYKSIIEELRGEVDHLKVKLHRVSSDTSLTNNSRSVSQKCDHCSRPENGDKVKEVQETLFENFIPENRNSQCLICLMDTGKHISQVIKRNSDTTILIGPEGDFTPVEIEAAKSQKYIPASLGKGRLRTETAGIVACSALSILNHV